MRRRIALLLLTRLHFGSLVWGKVVACERYGGLEVGELLAGELLSIREPEVTVWGKPVSSAWTLAGGLPFSGLQGHSPLSVLAADPPPPLAATLRDLC